MGNTKIVFKKNRVRLKNKQATEKLKGGAWGALIGAALPIVAKQLLGLSIPAEVAEAVGPEIATHLWEGLSVLFGGAGSWIGGFYTKSKAEDLEAEDAA